MGNLNKRLLSFLLAVMLLCGLLPLGGVQAQAATVNYVYDGQYLYNWGSRGTVATFMSPNALAFYEDNNVSLDSLANLSGSASTGSVPSSTLYQTLKTLMTNNHSYKTSYDATKSLYKYTDCQNSGGKISSFYSGNAIGPEWGQGSWNREHTWPNSKGLGGQDETDIMMLRPTSTSENSSRSNTAYGESSDYYNPNKESNGKYNLHGDVARIMLYTYVRWGNTSYMWGKSGVMESREVLLKWMEEDPVDTWELGRNDAVEAITGTRNVFVDYPELVFQMFGSEIPANYTTPSGGSSSSVSYNITATSNNTAWGTVSVAGRTVTANPASGYEVSDYELLSGTATVSRSGNQFILSPSTDVSIRINFAQKVAVPTVSEMKTGDQVVIYAPAYNKALTATTVASYYLAGMDITQSNGTITGYDNTAVWTVTANTDGTYSFSNGSQKLGIAAEKNSMNLGLVNDKWALVALGDGLYKVQNTARGNYMEWYSSKDNWSTYTSANDSQFHISFYVVGKGIYDGASSTPETPDEPDQPVTPPVTPETSTSLKNGAQVVIYAPAYNKALTATTIASYYLAGMDITVSGGAVTGYDNTAIWTVTANTDGTYSFSNGGQKLGIAAEKNSMNLGLVNDQWQLISLGGSLYQVKNTVRGNYMEWYSSKDNWSTYTSANDDQFQLSFYVIGEGILEEPAAPNPDPTPDPEPDEPVTPPVVTGGGSADFNTIVTGNPNGDSSYTGTFETADGWIVANSAIQCGGSQDMNPQFVIIGPDNTHKAPCLNGKTSAVGTLTSPTLTGGISKLTIDYTKMFTDTALSVTVTVTDLTTGTTQTRVIAKTLDKNEKYVVYTDEWTLETPITGDFTIEVANNCPSNSTSNKDRFTILNLAWEGAAATTPEAPENLPTASDIFFAIDFGSSMTVNALIPMEVLDSFDSYSVKLSAEGREPMVLTSGGNYLNAYYEFAYANLTALDIAKTVNVELTVTKDGQSYTTTDQKSILSFCETAIAKNSSDAEPCAFLLQYAKAAAAYKEVEGVEVSAAAQSVIDGSSLKDALPGEAIRERENGQQIVFQGQSLDMTARIAINFHIDLYNYTGDVNDLTFDVNGKQYSFGDLEDDGDGIYILSYSDFAATEMSKPAKCTVKVNGQVEAWYETSVERYCRGTLNNTNSKATMIELAKCIYRYGAACAKTYGN